MFASPSYFAFHLLLSFFFVEHLLLIYLLLIVLLLLFLYYFYSSSSSSISGISLKFLWFSLFSFHLIPWKVQEPMMEAQQNQALQQSQSQSSNNTGNILPWGAPASSSSTVNNTALPNPWGAISTPPAQPFGTYKILFSLYSVYHCAYIPLILSLFLSLSFPLSLSFSLSLSMPLYISLTLSTSLCLSLSLQLFLSP